MKALEENIREAFDGVSMPADLKAKTMAAIAQEASRAEASKAEEVATERPADVSSETAKTPLFKRRSKQKGDTAVARQPFLNRAFGLAVAACVLLAALGFGGFSAYSTETAFVGIDVNPSLELGVNRFDHVVSAQAFNDDGQKVLEEVPLKGKTYDEALEILANDERFAQFVNKDSFFELNIVCDNPDQATSLESKSTTYLAELPCESVCTHATSEVREAAHGAHMGVGRYQAAQTLLDLDQGVTLEECKHMSMRELSNRIIAAGGELPEGIHHGGHGQGYGQGTGQGNTQSDGQGSNQGNGQGTGQGNGQGAGQGNGMGQNNGQGQKAHHDPNTHHN